MPYAPLLAGRSHRTAVPFDPTSGEFRHYLESLPAGDAQNALYRASDHFEALNQRPIEWRLRTDLAEVFRQHVETHLQALEGDLSETALPVSPSRYTAARIAHRALSALAKAYKSALAGHSQDPRSSVRTADLVTPLVQNMRALAHHLVISHRIYAPRPAGVWQDLHALFDLARRQGVSEAAVPGNNCTAADVYRNALLFAFAEPPTFMHRDVEMLLGYLARFGRLAVLSRRRQCPSEAGIFVITSDRDAPGSALDNDGPQIMPKNDLILDCRPLIEALLNRLQQANSVSQPATPGIPGSADDKVSRDLMQRLVRHWGHVESRQHGRLRADYQVELLVGLRAIWNFLLGGGEAGLMRDGSNQWRVINESAGGFELKHISGRCAPIRVGEVVGIRSQENCHICVVRWAKSAMPDHPELGVQGFAPVATPVALGNGNLPAGEPALLLPEVPTLRRGPAILASFGRIDAKKDYRLDHCGLQWQVCATILLDQTPSVQLFGFSPSTASWPLQHSDIGTAAPSGYISD